MDYTEPIIQSTLNDRDIDSQVFDQVQAHLPTDCTKVDVSNSS